MERKFDSGEATIMIVPAKLVKKIEVDPRIRAVQFNNKLTPYLCCGDCKSFIQSVQTELASFRFRRSPNLNRFVLENNSRGSLLGSSCKLYTAFQRHLSSLSGCLASPVCYFLKNAAQ